MADGPDAGVLPGIAALPPTTARQIGSGQVLVDPSSVVRELIDNALDARAKSIFVDITANTIDSIQVKDDGHGIPAEDRALVCRRYCTSKIRDFHDLKEVGGKWLGFRGEALSSMAEMSGTLSITTRVEGEPVAVKLKYGRDGELNSTERDSHPVGTTVKITHFFEHIPVRKQTAIKSPAKWLVKIRHLMQAYALARPAVRFRLRVLKAKNNKGDFVYAPKANANVEDVVLKVIGKDCALQCDWTALESDGFEIHAFLPKPNADASKITNHGAFVSIDARPMSSSRRTVKQLVTAVKDRLRKSNVSLGGMKDPFFCMNIICPPNSYDPNIEPAKDDVMFENGDLVMSAINKLLTTYYPAAVVETWDIEPPTSAQRPDELEAGELPTCDQTPVSVYEDNPTGVSEERISTIGQDHPRWRSSMYGIDEDDLEFLQENQAPVVEEEDDLRAVAVSNPWTIARMNAPIKLKKTTVNGQLLSPAKSQSGATPMPRSPTSVTTPQHRASQVEPLTPQTSSRMNISRSSLDDELERSIQHLPQPSSEHLIGDGGRNGAVTRDRVMSSVLPSEVRDPPTFAQADFQHPRIHPSEMNQSSSMLQEMPPQASSAPRRTQRKQQTYNNKPFHPPAQALNDTWFGQPMSGSGPSQPSRCQKRAKPKDVPLCANDIFSSPRRPVLATAERLTENRLYSENNTDIRDFLRRNAGPQISASNDPPPGSSFTTINPQSLSNHFRGRFSQSPAPRTSSAGSERTSLLRQRSQDLSPALNRHRRGRPTGDAEDMEAYFREYEKREDPTSNKPASPVRRGGPRIAPAHESGSKTRRLRRRTTDGLKRTKSSKLPLERVPHGYRIQDMVLSLPTSLDAVVQSSHKLDMSRNSLEWGYHADETFDVFAEHVTERRIMDWVITLDEMLHERYERMERVDTRCELHEGIQRGLDARKEQDNALDMIATPAPAPALSDDVVRNVDVNTGDVQQPISEAPEQAEDSTSEFDMSQFVGLDADAPESTMGKVEDKDPIEVVDDFDEDIEDDMLMDI